MTDKKVSEGLPVTASDISLRVVAADISSAKAMTASLSANAAPPEPIFWNISTIVSSICSSAASGPQMLSRITSLKVLLPVAILGRAAAISPTVSSALQIALPINSQSLTINLMMILITSF